MNKITKSDLSYIKLKSIAQFYNALKEWNHLIDCIYSGGSCDIDGLLKIKKNLRKQLSRLYQMPKDVEAILNNISHATEGK